MKCTIRQLNPCTLTYPKRLITMFIRVREKKYIGIMKTVTLTGLGFM